VFTRLLIGLDGSPNADEALEQAVVLGKRFKAKLVVAHVKERDGAADLLDRAKERVKDAGLAVETVLRGGNPDIELAALARDDLGVLGGPVDARRRGVGHLVDSVVHVGADPVQRGRGLFRRAVDGLMCPIRHGAGGVLRGIRSGIDRRRRSGHSYLL